MKEKAGKYVTRKELNESFKNIKIRCTILELINDLKKLGQVSPILTIKHNKVLFKIHWAISSSWRGRNILTLIPEEVMEDTIKFFANYVPFWSPFLYWLAYKGVKGLPIPEIPSEINEMAKEYPQ